MKLFKYGDRVKMLYNGQYVHGEITVANSTIQRKEGLSSKVLFDEDWAPDYWYYLNDELELDETWTPTHK